MRYMIIVKSSGQREGADYDQGVSTFEEMGKYNQSLVDAGILLAAEGLSPSKDGATVTFKKGGQFVVKDGPFTEAKELVAGFWIIQVKSLDEAVEWAKRIPGFADGEHVEIRRVAEASDFADVMSPDQIAAEEKMRDTIASKAN
ncbi:MAG: YciI family protein [Devosia sp.]